MTKYAVCLLYEKDGKVLAITRKGTDDDWGLIGGKVEIGETNKNALIREVKEETNLDINLIEDCYQSYDKFSNTYVAVYKADVKGEIIPEEDTKVDYVEWDKLFKGTFGEFNRELYRHIYKKLT